MTWVPIVYVAGVIIISVLAYFSYKEKVRWYLYNAPRKRNFGTNKGANDGKAT